MYLPSKYLSFPMSKYPKYDPVIGTTSFPYFVIFPSK